MRGVAGGGGGGGAAGRENVDMDIQQFCHKLDKAMGRLYAVQTLHASPPLHSNK